MRGSPRGTSVQENNPSVRICIVTTSFPRWPEDDRGTFVIGAARALLAHGVQVRVVSIHSPGAKAREVLDSIEVIRPRYLWPDRLECLQRESGGMPIVLRKNRLAWLAVPPFFAAQSLATARYARDCDLIHANWTMSAAAAWVTSGSHRRPFIVTVQGSDVFESERIAVLKYLNRAILKRCRRVLALSRSLADATIGLGVPGDKVEVVPNGVDTQRFTPSLSSREPLVLAVGSLIERKGMRYLIQAMANVLPALPDFKLVIVGEGPQLQSLLTLARSIGLADRISITGYQTHQQVSAWMQRASLFILPSLEEGLGVVLLEALASGVPCVATQVGGIPDVITADTGSLVPAADSEALGRAISTLLNDPNRLERMRHNARQRAIEHYDWSIIAARLIRIYQDTLAHSRTRRTPGQDSKQTSETQ